MRFAPPVIAACFVLLACGGSQSSQANNVHASAMNAAAASAVPANPITRRVSGPAALSIMHDRHEGMEAIGKANKSINRELAGSGPDLTVVRLSAGQIAKLSRQATGWFPAGTGPELGKTGAKPQIWQTPQDFAVKLANFQKAAQAFNAA